MIATVREMTDRNQHTEARLFIATHVLRDEDLTRLYRELLEEQNRRGFLPMELVQRRHCIDHDMLAPRLYARDMDAYYEAL